MGGLSIWHWIIVGGVVFVLFGGKFKISDVMTDFAKGIKAFKKGMAEDEITTSASEEPPKAVERLSPDHAALDKVGEAKKL
jgi:sec-independent protein translocase protein TatA